MAHTPASYGTRRIRRHIAYPGGPPQAHCVHHVTTCHCCRKERRPSMAVQVPTPEQVKAAATEVGLSLTDEDIQSYIDLMKPNVHAYNLVDAMPDYLPVVRYPRTPGSFPPPEENT